MEKYTSYTRTKRSLAAKSLLNNNVRLCFFLASWIFRFLLDIESIKHTYRTTLKSKNVGSFMTNYSTISWWCETQSFSCFCMWLNTAWVIQVCPFPSFSPVSNPDSPSSVSVFSFISKSLVLSSSSWLQAMHNTVP